jgi:hypothetical protein
MRITRAAAIGEGIQPFGNLDPHEHIFWTEAGSSGELDAPRWMINARSLDARPTAIRFPAEGVSNPLFHEALP